MSFINKNLSKFKLITFDVTDTLLKFRNAPAIEYAKAASKFGYHTIDQHKMSQNFKIYFKSMSKEYPNFGKNNNISWDDWWSKLVTEIFNSTNSSINKNDLINISKTLIKQYETPECWIKIKGADEILNKIKEQKKIIGIISNFDPRLDIILKNMNLLQFHFILNSYDVGYQKPRKEIFDTAINEFNKINRNDTCVPSQALHIGNLPDIDYIGAKNAGWSSILISNETSKLEAHQEINKKHVFKSLEELVYGLNHIDIWQ